MHVPESLRDLAGSEAVQFLKKRKTVARIFAGVFSLIIFASLMTDGYMNVSSSPQLHCVLNNNGAACRYAIVAGFLAFLGSLVFLILDTQEPYITGTRLTTVIFLLDFVLSGKPSLPQLYPLCRSPRHALTPKSYPSLPHFPPPLSGLIPSPPPPFSSPLRWNLIVVWCLLTSLCTLNPDISSCHLSLSKTQMTCSPALGFTLPHIFASLSDPQIFLSGPLIHLRVPGFLCPPPSP
uniref:Synaptogyrin 4 n=1 Tax=Ornithorhynchus anatinus TaxID=9258 RepID=A0A6I8NI43_ORNAN